MTKTNVMAVANQIVANKGYSRSAATKVAWNLIRAPRKETKVGQLRRIALQNRNYTLDTLSRKLNWNKRSLVEALRHLVNHEGYEYSFDGNLVRFA